MSKISRKLSLVVLSLICVFLVSVKTGEQTNASVSESCPEANISSAGGSASIRCLEGMTALCKGGLPEPCTCTGRRKPKPECSGACSVLTNWGGCSIGCAQGKLARCLAGRSEWVGNHQQITPPSCTCR